MPANLNVDIMNCHEAKRCIAAEEETRLPSELKAGLVEHLAVCPACRRLNDDLRATVAWWREESELTPLPDVDLEWQKVRHAMNRPNRIPLRTFFAWSAVPVAAAAAVAVGLYIAPNRPDVPPSAQADQVVSAPASTTSSDTPASTIIYVDDKSGWTFVWAPTESPGRHI